MNIQYFFHTIGKHFGRNIQIRICQSSFRNASKTLSCIIGLGCKKSIAVFLVLILIVSATGCAGEKKGATITPGSSITPAPKKPVTEAPTQNAGEIAFTGVFTYTDANDMKMHFMDINTGTEYEVAYTGGTDIQGKYGTIMAASNMKLGEIYEITCDKSGKAKTVHGASKAWERSGVTGIEFDESAKKINIGASSFSYNSSAVILSGTEQISIAQLVAQDELTLRGIDNTVYSISVDKGHGYVQFTGIDSFIGGYASLGRHQLLGVTSGMLVTAREGTYTVELQLDSLRAEKTVTVERGQQTSLDFSEYAPEPTKNGAVNFMVTPKDAIMTIDGKEVDYSQPVSLTYGAHKLTLAANHFEEYTEVFAVNSPYQTKVIDMTAKSASTKATTAADQSKGYKVEVTAPEGAALYVDSVYIGVIPCSFDKKSGSRTITLTRSGYETVSYTISIANSSGNLTYAFPQMEKNGAGSGSTNAAQSPTSAGTAAAP